MVKTGTTVMVETAPKMFRPFRVGLILGGNYFFGHSDSTEDEGTMPQPVPLNLTPDSIAGFRVARIA